jgi:hypothetical protein
MSAVTTYKIFARKHNTGSNTLPQWSNGEEYESVAIPLCLLESLINRNLGSKFDVNTGESPDEHFRRKVLENIRYVIDDHYSCLSLDETYKIEANWDVTVLYSRPQGDNWVPATDPYGHPLFGSGTPKMVVVALEGGTYRSAWIVYDTN